MKRTLLLLLVVVVILGVMAPVVAGTPKKVAICHFDGHDAGFTFGQQGFTGDYVINFGADGPTATYCEGVGGHMIIVSVNALDGHGAEGLDRVAAYPDGWKG